MSNRLAIIGAPSSAGAYAPGQERDPVALLQQYQRKSQWGQEPNDRSYDRRVEKKLKQMRPEDLDAILNSEEELPQQPKQKKKDEQGK